MPPGDFSSSSWPSGAVAGVGVDLVEIGRVKALLDRYGKRFLDRMFTAAEQAYCDSKRDRHACYAARFAAKEAALKAVGSGLSRCRWTDVEILAAESGRPVVVLSGGAAVLAVERHIGEVKVSLSHDRGRAMAFAVAVGEGRRDDAGSNGR